MLKPQDLIISIVIFQGLIRMSNAATVMMSQGGNVPSSMVAAGAGAGAELQTRTSRPSSQPGANM